MTAYHLDLTAGNLAARLRINITAKPGVEDWQCFPAEFVGAGRGKMGWTNTQLALFSMGGAVPGAQAYAVLDIPEDGLDEVPLGTSGELRVMHTGTVGSWTITDRK